MKIKKHLFGILLLLVLTVRSTAFATNDMANAVKVNDKIMHVCVKGSGEKTIVMYVQIGRC